MAKSPFYKIILSESNEDITKYVTSFEYEDCIDEDDHIELNLNGLNFNTVDSDIFDVGNELKFQYGFIGGDMSSTRKCIIIESDCDYDGMRINMNIKCRDLGIFAKKLTSNYVFKNKSASEITKIIADSFGLESVIDETSTKYESMPMGNKNFLQFLKELAIKEGSSADDTKGSFEVFIRSSTLYFTRRDISKSSSRLYKYGDGITVTSFNVEYEDKQGSSDVSVSGIDSETGKTFTSKTSSSDSKETATGDKSLNFSVDGVLKNMPEDIKKTTSNKVITAPAKTEQEAKLQTGSYIKDSKSKIMKATIDLELDPTCNADEIITMSGVAQKHAGNWRIHKCTHKISNSAATTTLTCYRNGAKVSGTKNNSSNTGNVNKSQGNTNGYVEKSINFTVNGTPK